MEAVEKLKELIGQTGTLIEGAPTAPNTSPTLLWARLSTRGVWTCVL